MKKCVIYSRVSTSGQDYETQKEDLLKYATGNGYNVAGVYGFYFDILRFSFETKTRPKITNPSPANTMIALST
jgi:DNA invertase Pin-like site-specific DNA recombinase